MQSKAIAKFVRYAPRKVNQVLTLIRNKPVAEALEILRFVPKKSSELIASTIRSAAANAGDVAGSNPKLMVEQVWVGQGPVLKRTRAYAMGRGFMYKRKTCHLTVILSDTGKPRKKGKKQ